MDTPKERDTALITGASSGIGAELARELASRGYDLILTARRTDRLEALKREIEGGGRVRVHVISADLATAAGASMLIEQVDALGLPVSFLVNNAGFGIHGDLLDHDRARLEQMLQLNMASLTTLSWHFGRGMRARQRGHILQVSSVGAFQPSPYYAAYSATKAYVLFMSEAMNHELRGSGVSCTTLCPGLTATEFHDVAAHPKTGPMKLTEMTAAEVAAIGVTAALRGKAVVTPGLLNKLSALMVKLLPRSWATFVAGMLMKD